MTTTSCKPPAAGDKDSTAEHGRRQMRNACDLAARLPSVIDPAGKRATVRTVTKMATDGLRMSPAARQRDQD